MQKKYLPENMKVSEYNAMLCNRLFELMEDFCNGKQYFRFTKITGNDFPCSRAIYGEQSDAATLEDSVLQRNNALSTLSCPEPSYKKDDAKKGLWVYSYTTLAKSKGHTVHDTEIRNLENPEKEPENETDDDIESEENIGIKGVDFGNIMHKALEEVPFSKVMQHKDQDSAAEDEELLDLAEHCAKGFVNSDLAFKSRIPVIKLLHKTLATTINAGGSLIRIGDIPESDRKHELDFMFKIKHGKINIGKELNGFDLEDGFIKGFIDMIFRFNGSYYIVDWKTNFLGSSLNDYGQENLENAMISNNYKIQMSLYTIALDMMIASENNNGFRASSDNAGASCPSLPAIGGCFYLFLRGLSGGRKKEKDEGEKSNIFFPGVYFSPPDYDAINNFKKIFLE